MARRRCLPAERPRAEGLRIVVYPFEGAVAVTIAQVEVIDHCQIPLDTYDELRDWLCVEMQRAENCALQQCSQLSFTLIVGLGNDLVQP
jgi:hypothetical protein